MIITEKIEVKDHLKLVHKQAIKYSKLIRDNAADYDDVYQAGCMGLYRATQDFDINKGYKFSTYAVSLIRSYMLRFLDEQTHAIRFPVHTVILSKKITKEELTDQCPVYIAKQLDCTIAMAQQALYFLKYNERCSLDASGVESEDDHYFWVPTYADYTSLEAQEFVVNLTPRRQEILRLMEAGYTQTEIGKMYGVTRGAIYEHLKKIRIRYRRQMEKSS